MTCNKSNIECLEDKKRNERNDYDVLFLAKKILKHRKQENCFEDKLDFARSSNNRSGLSYDLSAIRPKADIIKMRRVEMFRLSIGVREAINWCAV